MELAAKSVPPALNGNGHSIDRPAKVSPAPNAGQVSPRLSPLAANKLSITVEELMQLVNNHMVGVLIMDCRPKDEFVQSHLNWNNCLNVPEEIIQKG